MRISNLPRLLVLEGAGFRACSAGIQHPDQTLLVVFADGLLMVAILVVLLLTFNTCIFILFSTSTWFTVFRFQPQMRMGLLANKIYQLLGRRKFKPMFAYLGVIVVPLLLYIV